VGSGLLATFPIQAENKTISGPFSASSLLDMAGRRLLLLKADGLFGCLMNVCCFIVAGLTPYSFAWTLSGNSNANITYFSLLNTQKTMVVEAKSSSVYAAVAELVATTDIGQYVRGMFPHYCVV
jgi:hypothetical protein